MNLFARNVLVFGRVFRSAAFAALLSLVGSMGLGADAKGQCSGLFSVCCFELQPQPLFTRCSAEEPHSPCIMRAKFRPTPAGGTVVWQVLKTGSDGIERPVNELNATGFGEEAEYYISTHPSSVGRYRFEFYEDPNSDTSLFCGLAYSGFSEFVWRESPAVNLDPNDANQQVCAGATVRFHTVSTNAQTYQWTRIINGTSEMVTNGTMPGGVTVSGATTGTLTFSNVQASTSGSYQCVVDVDDCLNDVSERATLTVVSGGPALTAQPTGGSVCVGGSRMLSVAASGPGLVYQWYRVFPNLDYPLYEGAYVDNTTRTSGGTTNTLTLSNVGVGAAGEYYCVVSNFCGTVTSTHATVSVPANVEFYVVAPAQINCVGENAVLYVTAAPAGQTYFYRWSRRIPPATAFTDLSNGTLPNATAVSGATTHTLTLGSIAAGDAGEYRCTVSTAAGLPVGCGTITSSPIPLTVVTGGPVFTQNPVNTGACPGEVAEFTIVATNNVTQIDWHHPVYQWLSDGVLPNGTIVQGAHTQTLRLSGVHANDEGNYTCSLLGQCGQANVTRTAHLDMPDTPTITQQPQALTFGCAGAPLFLTVAAEGMALSYQWMRNGIDLATSPTYLNVNSPTLRIETDGAGLPATFSCRVSACTASTISNSASVQLRQSVQFTGQPAAQPVCAGSNAIFSVTATGAAPVTYAWRKNGVALTNGNGVSGAATATLTITGVDPNDVANYQCIASNSCGSATSQLAALTIVGAPTITQHPASREVCTADPDQVFTVAGASPLPVTYRWQRNGSDLSENSRFSGVTTPQLTVVVVGVPTSYEGNYRCVVSNSCGATTSNVASMQAHSPPLITQHPQATTVCSGAETTLAITTLPDGVQTFQWMRNGVDLSNDAQVSGATTRTLRLSDVTADLAGNYRCRAAAGMCSVLSNAAALTVSPLPVITQQPASASTCAGSSATLSVAATGANLTYQWQKDQVDIVDATNVVGATTATLTLSSLQAAAAGNYRCFVRSGSCQASSNEAALTVTAIITQPIAQAVCDGSNTELFVTTNGSGVTYRWQLRRPGQGYVNIPITTTTIGGTIYAGGGLATLSITNVNASSAVDYRCAVTATCGTINSETVHLSLAEEVSITANPVPTAACTEGSATFAVVATGPNLSYRWQRNQANLSDGPGISGSQTSTLQLNSLTSGSAGNYRCVVSNACGSRNSTAAALTVDPTTSIVTHPVPLTICVGGSASFAVTATGSSIAYQWQRDQVNLIDGPGISGATSPTLNLSGVMLAGTYRCIVTGSCGPTPSNAAELILASSPQITEHPQTGRSCPSAPTTFSVTATSDPAPSYRWQWRPTGTSTWTDLGVGVNPASGTSRLTAQGVNTATLSVQSLAILPGSDHFRCVVGVSECEASSDSATFTICPADHNCSGSLTVQDLFSFLAAWFAGEDTGDFDHSGTASVQDIFSFLAAWFSGCN